MPASAATKTRKNKQNGINFKFKNKVKSAPNHSDEILVIFQHLEAKLQRFQNNKFLKKKFWENSLFQFYDDAKAAKKRLRMLSEHSELKKFMSMFARIYIDALKISKQMRLNISEKLGTARLI